MSVVIDKVLAGLSYDAATIGNIEVNVSSPSDNDVLTYDSGTQTWVAAAGGGGATDLITAITGTQSIDFSSGNMIFDSSGDINFNVNNTPYRMNFGADNIRLFGMGGTTSTVIEFRELGGGNFVALKGPNSLGSDITLTLPSADASGPLVSDGSGTLSFEAGASGTFTTADAKTVTVTNGVITSIV